MSKTDEFGIMVVEQDGRMVKIVCDDGVYVAVLSAGGSPVTSRHFKTEKGALVWAHKKVMR